MSKEEPAWKAELAASLLKFDVTGVAWLIEFVEPHIEAAEQRGREAARREAAAEIRALDPVEIVLAGMWALTDIADLIDPDKA